MAWSKKVYPTFNIDMEREQAAFRRALVRRQIDAYLGLDDSPKRLDWLDFGLFYYRLTLFLEHFQALPDGAERSALRPLLAEALIYLRTCRAAMSDRSTGRALGEEDALDCLGNSWIPPY